MDAFCLLVVSCLGVAQPTVGGRQRTVEGAGGIWEHCLRVKAFRLLVDSGLGVASQRQMVGGARGIWEHCLRMDAFCLPMDGKLGVAQPTAGDRRRTVGGIKGI